MCRLMEIHIIIKSFVYVGIFIESNCLQNLEKYCKILKWNLLFDMKFSSEQMKLFNNFWQKN